MIFQNIAEIYQQRLEKGDSELILLAAPNIEDKYYEKYYDAIINFQVKVAKELLAREVVIIMADAAAIDRLSQSLPRAMLLQKPMGDIWLRDFGLVTLRKANLFRYTAAAQAGNQQKADFIQSVFEACIDQMCVSYQKVPLILDGGNIIWNGSYTSAIVTERFLFDNNVKKSEGKAVLKKQLGCQKIATIPLEEPAGLGHVDCMAMFIDDDVLVINRYLEPLRTSILTELKEVFGSISIIEVDRISSHAQPFDKNFASVYGNYTNALVTKKAIYMPVFNSAIYDRRATEMLTQYTKKEIVPIASIDICALGGNIRCLSCQISGKNAKRIINNIFSS